MGGGGNDQCARPQGEADEEGIRAKLGADWVASPGMTPHGRCVCLLSGRGRISAGRAYGCMEGRSPQQRIQGATTWKREELAVAHPTDERREGGEASNGGEGKEVAMWRPCVRHAQMGREGNKAAVYARMGCEGECIRDAASMGL